MAARPRVKLLAFAALLLVLAQGTTGTPDTAASSFVDEVIHLTNTQRRVIKGRSCPALVPSGTLMAVAQQHTHDMAIHNFFSHSSPNGTSPWQRIVASGYHATHVAENIAAGQRSPRDVVGTWMRSPHHRANLLNCRLREIGVGFAHAEGSAFGSYWVAIFAASR